MATSCLQGVAYLVPDTAVREFIPCAVSGSVGDGVGVAEGQCGVSVVG